MKISKILLLFTLIFICSCSDEIVDSGDNQAQIEKRHRFSTVNFGFTPCESVGLTYYIDDCFDGTIYEAAIPDAIQNYNDLETLINLTEVTDSTTADIVFDCFSTTVGCAGGGTEPRGNSTLIEINIASYYANCCPGQATPTLCQATMIAMHEMGHAFGFGHTNNLGAVLVPGTLVTDPESILNDGDFYDWCNLPCDFSDGDIQALEIQYGEAEHEISGPDVICVNTLTEYCLPQGIFGAWSKKSWPPNIPVSENCSSYSFASPGYYTIHTMVGNCPVTKSIQVVDDPCPLPSTPPYEFDSVCFFDNQVCADYSWINCLESVEVSSSHPKLLVEVNGLEICLTSIHPIPFTATVTIVGTSVCGGQSTVTYTLSINDPTKCLEDGDSWGFGG